MRNTNSMITYRTKYLAALVLAVVVISACGNKDDKKGSGKGSRAATVVEAIVVSTAEISNSLEVTGSVLANEEVQLMPESAGKLIDVLFTEGQPVSKGQLLAQLNSSEIKARLQRLKADEQLAQDDESRKKRLLEINAISQQEYDVAQNKLDGLKADISQAQAQIAKLEIRAPFGGTIGLRYVSPGAFVSTSTPIATLIQANPIKLEFAVPERYVSVFRKNQPVEFSIVGSHKKYGAKVYAAESKIDPQTRAIKVRAHANNSNGELVPGSFARVSLLLDKTLGTIMVPPQTLVPEIKGQKVFLYKGGKAIEQLVETGVRTGTYVEVISGLNVGDTLITTGLNQIRNGVPVQVNIVTFNSQR
ncbi:MAG: efflux RND transporter periplasmic adaptor subunit [Bacteroidales bacterium]|nr:efflux RND transporter periplasmic adaptor subunit [Bacteroidales bacterium]MBN2749827.1 efflux RND transporter periplasmic adaptor subunit [Bacteroidales bacterium]